MSDQRDALAEVLAGHVLQYGPRVGQICSCGHVVRVGDVPRLAMLTQQEIHRAHVAEQIEPLIQQAEMRGAVGALRDFHRLMVRAYPKGLVATATVIADAEELIDRADQMARDAALSGAVGGGSVGVGTGSTEVPGGREIGAEGREEDE